jgi:hypothetical protein
MKVGSFQHKEMKNMNKCKYNHLMKNKLKLIFKNIIKIQEGQVNIYKNYYKTHK